MLHREVEEVFEACVARSNNLVGKLRQVCQSMFNGDTSLIIGINGSYARREATEGSDIDLFFLTTQDNIESAQVKQKQFRIVVEKDHNLRLPSAQGVFEDPLTVDSIMEIGGLQDDNTNITRRMLLLLEGEWLFNEEKFGEIRRGLLNRYLHDGPSEDKICMFLLNDIIRYWRTICVDLEHKTYGEGKAREIRLIKLRFSRILLYLSGIIAVGNGYGLSAKEKMEQLESTFAQYPVERMREVLGQKLDPALEIYAEFLKALDDPATRGRLEAGLPVAEDFERLTTKARSFRDCLHCMLRQQFPEDGDNPTLRAILL